MCLCAVQFAISNSTSAPLPILAKHTHYGDYEQVLIMRACVAEPKRVNIAENYVLN